MIRIIILMSLISCAGINDNSVQSCKRDLKSDLSKNWKFNVDYYETNPRFLQRLDTMFKPCIIKMNKEDIIDLFGKPTSTAASSLTFSISKPPKKEDMEKDGTTWRYFNFYFDSTGLVNRFNESGQTISIEK